MLRFYLDSNIYRYLKNESPNYNKELHEFLVSLVDKKIFIYSDAHLYDLKDSPRTFAEIDLKLMEEYTRDSFFRRDPIKNITECLLAKPIDAFNSIDFEAMDGVIKNFNLDDLIFNKLDDSDESNKARDILKSVFDLPLSSIGETINLNEIPEEHKKWFDKVTPNYRPDMSLRDFMNEVMPYGGTLLNDAKEVKELRDYLRSYAPDDTYNFKTWGMEFNTKFKEKFGKTFLEMIDASLLDDQKKDFFIRFQRAYAMLELYNVTQERQGGKAKKFNFWSLNNDAMHCYFGTMSDCLISDDSGLLQKAGILYDLFEIPTAVFSSKQLLEQRSKFLTIKGTNVDFIKNIRLNLLQEDFYKAECEIDTKNVITYYTASVPLIGIFDRFCIIRMPTGSFTYIFYFHRPPTDCRMGLMYREIELVIDKLNEILGIDIQQKGAFNFSEEFSYGQPIRTWILSSMVLEFILQGDSSGVYIDLYIQFQDPSEDALST